MDRPVRKPTRLKNYDYRTPGAYFITFCTREKRCILSQIAEPSGGNVGEGLAPPAVKLTAIGRLTEAQIASLPQRFPGVSVDRYVIMPNHVHLLLTLSGNYPSREQQTAPLRQGEGDQVDIIHVVQVLKSQSSRLYGRGKLWQRSFYDHIVRGEEDYRAVAAYIDANPARWVEDRFFPNR